MTTFYMDTAQVCVWNRVTTRGNIWSVSSAPHWSLWEPLPLFWCYTPNSAAQVTRGSPLTIPRDYTGDGEPLGRVRLLPTPTTATIAAPPVRPGSLILLEASTEASLFGLSQPGLLSLGQRMRVLTIQKKISVVHIHALLLITSTLRQEKLLKGFMNHHQQQKCPVKLCQPVPFCFDYDYCKIPTPLRTAMWVWVLGGWVLR